MAELIPMEYRVSAAQRVQIRRWAVATVITAIMAGGALVFTCGWKQKQTAEFDKLNLEFHNKSVLITQAQALQTRRLDLAARMQKMQELMDDKTLLALLGNISTGFSNNDCLEYISIDAHGNPRQQNTDDHHPYKVRISGITADGSTHADLLNRLTELGSRADPPMTINPESLHREPMLDGTVMRFQISCDQPPAKGG